MFDSLVTLFYVVHDFVNSLSEGNYDCFIMILHMMQ